MGLFGLGEEKNDTNIIVEFLYVHSQPHTV